jgi:hypothetical protein
MTTLDGMTSEQWDSMSTAERERIRDYSGLSPQLKGLEHKRVEVVDDYGETRRFYVGMSTGWRPRHLEIKTRRSFGGMAADKHYQSVRVVGSR